MKKNKKLILHIGLYKTGSTSIQNSLYRNKAELFKLGVNYISLPKYIQTINGRQTFFNARKNIMADLLKKSPGHTHILSNEGLWDRKLLKKKTIEIIQSINIYDEIEIVAYVRRQDLFFKSFYKQENKIGALFVAGLTPEDFLENIILNDSLDYMKILSEYSSVFGENSVKVRVFELDKLINNDVVDDFLSTIKLAKPDNFLNYRMNDSISDEYGLITSHMNHILNKSFDSIGVDIDNIDVVDRNLIRSLVRTSTESILSRLDLNNCSMFDDSLIQKILEIYADSNRDLFKKFGIEFKK